MRDVTIHWKNKKKKKKQWKVLDKQKPCNRRYLYELIDNVINSSIEYLTNYYSSCSRKNSLSDWIGLD